MIYETEDLIIIYKIDTDRKINDAGSEEIFCKKDADKELNVTDDEEIFFKNYEEENGSGTEYYGEAEILRVYSRTPCVVIPGILDVYKVTKVGEYCFAEMSHVEEKYSVELDNTQKDIYHEAAGNYILEVMLPESIKSIGRNAFYNCRKLKSVTVGAACEEIGGDVFMNCRSLNTINVTCNVNERSGIKQLLSRYSSDIEVVYECNSEISAKIFYPEYVESYDEIAPAHIFGRNITGEGFRARECFTEGVPNLGQYDEIFEKASAEESIKTASKIALDRLLYPVDLSEKAKEQYLGYIREYDSDIMRILVSEKELETIYFLCSEGYIKAPAYDVGIAAATADEWGEGAASMLKWKHKFCGDIKKSRYSF